MGRTLDEMIECMPEGQEHDIQDRYRHLVDERIIKLIGGLITRIEELEGEVAALKRRREIAVDGDNRDIANLFRRFARFEQQAGPLEERLKRLEKSEDINTKKVIIVMVLVCAFITLKIIAGIFG